jgi:NAD(P)-dependent dehydrogenase (short-subunit alcohol dehydrogenase family)
MVMCWSDVGLSEMKDKVCIVTGCNSGIGKETALALARMSAWVVMVARNPERGEKARVEIVNQTGSKSVDLLICDVSSMDSIRHFAESFKQKYDRLDVLINNAGAVFGKREVTPEGFERTLAVDYLGAFFLTHQLLGLLKSSAPSRVVNVTSGLHKSGKINLDDLQSEKSFSGMKVYSNSKLMLLMFTYELAKRLEGSGVTVNAVEPGFVATNLGKSSGSLRSAIMFKMVRPMQINAKKGAETPVYLASSDEVKNVTGKCFIKKHETTTAAISYDQQLQKQLWNETVKLLGLTPD